MPAWPLDKPWTMGVLTGLKAEARLLRGLPVRVAVGGGGFRGAEQAVMALIAEGANALVSFGLAGGLNPALPPGTLLVPDTVLMEGVCYRCDRRLTDWLGGADGSLMLGGTMILADRRAKARAFDATGAAAIDMESGAVARIAESRRLPFAVLRAVCDSATHDLPPAALLALDPDGGIGMGRILRSLAQSPGQIISVLRVARDAALARRALRRRIATLCGNAHG